MNYAIIDDSNNLVINVAVWDGTTPWDPGAGLYAVLIPEGSQAGIGWTYEDGEFIPPEPPGPTE
jgi:hypothetical protein